jgi:hypothetical protein
MELVRLHDGIPLLYLDDVDVTMYQRGSTYIMSVNSFETLLSGLDIIFAPLKPTR